MCDLLAERGRLAELRVDVDAVIVTGEFCEFHDVRFGDRSFFGDDLLPNDKFLEIMTHDFSSLKILCGGRVGGWLSSAEGAYRNQARIETTM